MKTDSISNQLRWVILLLAAAVILPTVCLLWFMNQAVRNERLAVRQKLIDVYEEKTRPLIEHLAQKQATFEQQLQQAEQTDLFSFFTAFCNEKEYAEGMAIYNDNNQLLFPKPSDEVPLSDSHLLEKGWHSEFTDANYLEAAAAYQQVIENTAVPHDIFQGKLALIRCYEKASDSEKAIHLCKELAYPDKAIENKYTATDVIRARLKLIRLYQNHTPALFENEAGQLLRDITENAYDNSLPTEVHVFVLNALLESLEPSHWRVQHLASFSNAQNILRAETLSIQISEILSQSDVLSEWPSKTLQTIDSDETLYGILFKIADKKIILVCRKSSIIRVMQYIAEKLSDETAVVSVFDEQNRLVFGEYKNTRNAFLTIRPNDYLNGWKLAFFFRNADVFDWAANKQATIYTWTGILVAVLILATGTFAIRSVNYQIKMNRLKNDFIATVTHELKTPLSSMRLLVDTLLEGNYEGENTATEYLQMVANENKRLTHLIDSFLTFSRMERNKQVFDFEPIAPAKITAAATEAIQAKFKCSSGFQPESPTVSYRQNRCDFTCTINENLPAVYADKDGMVTALVNLLDNAYKYTNSDKQITLNVYQQDRFVCFAVKDNGIGLNPRSQRKIFNRFFQVDSRLSRRSEGCGLGLSIVKFIVDAHKGKIEVESQPGKGSVFVVKLAAMD